MTRALRFAALTATIAVLLPGVVRGQTGACRAITNEEVEVCLDGASEADCTTLGADTAFFEWLSGEACENLDIVWSGACDVPSTAIGAICVLVEPGGSTFDGFESCESIEGQYLGDGSICQQVPTLPQAGLAALALTLALGAAVMLTARRRTRAR